MGKITLSCGHEDPTLPQGVPVRLKSVGIDHFSRTSVPAVSYESWCRSCLVEALEECPDQLIFEDWQEEEYLDMKEDKDD